MLTKCRRCNEHPEVKPPGILRSYDELFCLAHGTVEGPARAYDIVESAEERRTRRTDNPPEIYETIERLEKEGLTLVDISAKVDRSYSFVYRVVKYGRRNS